MAVTTKKTFPATSNSTTTTFGPIGIELNNQDDLDVYITESGGTRVLQYKQSSASTTDSNHPQVGDTTGLYFPPVASGVALKNYTISADNNNVIFNSALPSGAVVSIERRTRDSSGSYTNFSGGSTIRSTDLNTALDEARFTAQEGRNKAFDLERQTFSEDGNIRLLEDQSLIYEGATDDGYETKLAVTDPTADRTITFPNVSGNVVTTGDTETVTSTMLVDGTIVNADVNASAAIAGTKVNPNFGSQAVSTSGTLAAGATTITGNLSVSGYVESRDISADGTKLDGIEAGATADQTGAEIKAAYEGESNTNAYTDAEKTKLAGIATGAEVNVQSDWNASSGDAQILNKPTIPSNLADLSNVHNSTPTDGQVLKWIDSNSRWEPAADATGAGGAALTDGDKGDITVSGTGAVWTIDNDTIGLDELSASGTPSNSKFLRGDNTWADAGSSLTIKDEGTDKTTAATSIDFVGSGVTATNSGSAVTVTVSGGGGNTSTDFKYLELRNAANNGAASYPASDFTLVTSGTTTALTPAQANALIVSYGGVIQQPNTGTGTPTTGFAISGSTIKFGSAITAAPDFIIYLQGAGVASIADNTVTGAKIALGSDAAGDIMYYNGTDYVRLAKGSDGEVLKLASGVPSWATDAGGISNIVEDTSPQLGGALDVQAQEINTSTTNGNIKLTPNGTGVVEVKGNTNPGTIQLNCENNSHSVKLKGPAHSAAASYTLTLPNDDGDANEVLKTDGSGNLDWVAQTAAYTHPNHSGEVTSTGDGATVIADNIVDEANLKVDNSPTNDYVLTAKSSAAGGLTWAAAAGGSSADGCIWKNSLTISNNHTIAATEGAHSVGPITNNATVTVNGRWVIS